MSQRLVLQFLELSLCMGKRFRNVSNLAHMSMFTSTSTFLMILAILLVLDTLFVRSPLGLQLEVLPFRRSVHRTLGVFVLMGITLVIAQATSLVLLHVLV